MPTSIETDLRVLDVFVEAVQGFTTATVEGAPDKFAAPPVPGVRIFAQGAIEHDAGSGLLSQRLVVIEYRSEGDSCELSGSELEQMRGHFGACELFGVRRAPGIKRSRMLGGIEAVASSAVVLVLPEVPEIADVRPEDVARVLAAHLHAVSRRQVDVTINSAAGSGSEFTVALRLHRFGDWSLADVGAWATEAAPGLAGHTFVTVGRVADVVVLRHGRVDDNHVGLEVRVTVETAPV